jgi:protein TonB
MLDRLLESKSRRARSPAGAIASVTAHTALIAAAVYATAQARVASLAPNERARPIYFARVSETPRASIPTAAVPGPAIHIVVPPVLSIPLALPALDAVGILSRPGDFTNTALGVGDILSAGAASGGTPVGIVLRAEQVEKQVAPAAGNAPPKYPEALRDAGVEGQVIAMFVVNEMGRAEDSTVTITHSDGKPFEESVRTALHRMRFVPAEVGGRKVRQLVQMPFVFTLKK